MLLGKFNVDAELGSFPCKRVCLDYRFRASKMVNDGEFGLWCLEGNTNSNAVSSAMMVVFAQFLIFKISDSMVSKN